MRRTEDTGEWDGVDLASAPCLQSHVARNIVNSKITEHDLPYVLDEVGFMDKAVSTHARVHKENGQQEPASIPARPSTPPALLLYKPCLR